MHDLHFHLDAARAKARALQLMKRHSSSLVRAISLLGGRWLGKSNVRATFSTFTRFGSGGTSGVIFGMTALATWGAAQGRGPLGAYSTVGIGISLPLCLIEISILMLLLAVLMQERRHLATLQGSKERFRTAFFTQEHITEQTLALHAHNGDLHTGNVTGGAPSAVAVLRDNAELKRVQAALAEQERLFRTLVENSPDMIARFDRNLRHRYVSPASETVIGIPANELIGKTHAELGLPEEVYAVWDDRLRQVFATGQRQVFETDYWGSSQLLSMSRVTYIPEFAADGSVESVLGITTDITELNQAEAALRQSEERFFQVFNRSPIAMTIVSRTSCRILDVNAAQSRLTRYSRSELIGRKTADLWHFSPWDIDSRQSQVRREALPFEAPMQMRTKCGETRSCLSSLAFITMDDEPCLIVASRDVTARERAEEGLRMAAVAAEAAQRQEEQRRLEAERRERIAESLHSILVLLNSDRQVSKILDYITLQAGRLLSSDAAVIYMTPSNVAPGEGTMAGRTPRSLEFQSAAGLPPAFTSAHGKRRLRVGDAAVRRAMATQLPVVVLAPTDVQAVPTQTARRYEDETESSDLGEQAGQIGGDASDYIETRKESLPAPYRALLAIPIVGQGQAYGSLLLLYTAPRRFRADEVALALAYGDQIALAVANARLQDHIERAAKENERNRLARELHDTVTQEIFAAKVLAESIPLVWERHRAEAEEQLLQVHHLTRSALAALRALLLELRPAEFERKSLADLLQQLAEVMMIRCGASITVTVANDYPPLPVATKVAFYRIAQEALTNAAKYANAHTIAVRLRYLPAHHTMQLDVQDDGQGFKANATPAGHFGLGMMRERARSVDAKLRISSHDGHGTRVSVKWAEKGRAGAVPSHKD